MDKCPKCGGPVKVLERSLEYWGGVHCEYAEQNSDSPASPVQQTQPAIALEDLENILRVALSGTAALCSSRDHIREAIMHRVRMQVQQQAGA